VHKVLVLTLLLVLCFGVSVFCDTDDDAMQDGGTRLEDLQQNDGGWDWPLDDGNPNDASSMNTLGPIAMGLARGYWNSGDVSFQAALSDAGAALLAKTNNFSPPDGYLAVMLDSVFGGSTYRDHVLVNFYNPLAAGTYDRNGAGTLYSTASYVQMIRDVRVGTGNLAEWDIGMGLVGAAAVGADTAAWIDGVKAELNEHSISGSYDVTGLAGALYGLAYVGEDFDPTAGDLASASNLNDLGDILAGYQVDDGGFTWDANWVVATQENVQNTAYAILALNQLDRGIYLDVIQGAADWLVDVQLTTGGWDNYPYYVTGENNELTGEAVWGIHAVYVEDVWVDEDGNDHAFGYGYIPFETLATAVSMIAGTNGTVHVGDGVFTLGPGTYVTRLSIEGVASVSGAGPTTIIDGGGADVITVSGTQYVQVLGLAAINGRYGILVAGDLADGSSIDGNTVTDTTWAGIRLIDLYGGSSIDGNTVENTGEAGIRLDDIWGTSSVDGNTVIYTDEAGIRLDNIWGNSSIDGNTIFNIRSAGIRLDDIWGNASIDGNIIFTTTAAGIHLDDMWGGASIDGNLIAGTGESGIRLWDMEGGASIDGNTLIDIGWVGIRLDDMWGGSSIDGNTITNTGWIGIYLDNAGGGASIDGNTITNTGSAGIRLDELYGRASVDGNTITDTSWAPGIRVFYVYGGASVDGNTVENAGYAGIRVDDIWGSSSVDDNTVIDSGYAGIRLEDIWGNSSVDGNFIVNSGWGCGIRLDDIWGNSSVDGNIVIDSGFCGIRLYDIWGNSSIDRNVVVDSEYCGIRLDDLWGASSIDGNVVVGSGWSGIHVETIWNPLSSISGNDLLGNGANGVIVEMLNNGSLNANVITGNTATGIRIWEVGCDGEAHWNSISGNGAGIIVDLGSLNAILNWWGDVDGPSGEGTGAGDSVSTNVIFSPWLGIDPDSDPGTPGVQLVSPMLFIVDDIGPAPALGYLGAAIDASNMLSGLDTIEVRHGTYDASEPITDPVNIVSEIGSATHTILNNPISINVSDVILGRMRQGFTINGDITVGAGVDASNIHINWNDILSIVTNSGTGTLDAIFNYWGEDGPDTVGSVAVFPLLPISSDTIIGYMDEHRLSALDAIDFAVLLDLYLSEREALAAVELMNIFGFSEEEAADIVREYGALAVDRALAFCSNYEDFLALMMGYAAGGGGGGSFLGGGGGGSTGISRFCLGCPIPLQIELVHPITGEVITDAVVSYSVCRTLPDGTAEIMLLGVMTYDADLGAYTFDVDTSEFEPGIYDIYLGTDDGRSRHFQVEVTE